MNLNVNSGNARRDIFKIKSQIDGLQKEIESKGLSKVELAERLEKMRADMLKAVRDTARLNASKRDVETILEQLKNLDRSKPRDVLGTIADLSALAGMALAILL